MGARDAVGILLAVVWAGASAFALPTNPVFPESTPDPTCWRAPDGTWRLASTSQKILKSKDFFTWEDTGRRLFTREDERRIRHEWKNIEAPDVIKLGNEYRLYVTHIRNAAESAIFVYSSKSADGPFTDGRLITYGKDTGIIDTIDPEVVREYGTGKLWLFYGSTGRVHRVPLTPASTSTTTATVGACLKARISTAATAGGIFSRAAGASATGRTRSSWGARRS